MEDDILRFQGEILFVDLFKKNMFLSTMLYYRKKVALSACFFFFYAIFPRRSFPGDFLSFSWLFMVLCCMNNCWYELVMVLIY